MRKRIVAPTPGNWTHLSKEQWTISPTHTSVFAPSLPGRNTERGDRATTGHPPPAPSNRYGTYPTSITGSTAQRPRLAATVWANMTETNDVDGFDLNDTSQSSSLRQAGLTDTGSQSVRMILSTGKAPSRDQLSLDEGMFANGTADGADARHRLNTSAHFAGMAWASIAIKSCWHQGTLTSMVDSPRSSLSTKHRPPGQAFLPHIIA